MNTREIAVPVRPGEHACCRFPRPEDRERLTFAFVRAGLERRHKVLCLHEPEDSGSFVQRLVAADARVADALASGQLEVRPARREYLPDGMFDSDRMLTTLRAEHRRALDSGFTGIAVTGDISVVSSELGAEELASYEQEVAGDPFDASRVLLCHYPQGRLPAAQLSALAGCHDVDVSPELAPIGREGALSAARVRSSQALRLAGELDYDGAPSVGDVLAAHFHGPLRLDLSDLTYVDVAGMRALRGRAGQPLTIAGASDAVKRLAEILAWDTDPDVELPAAA
jgi:anti-anti-sigma regulatory factor